MPAAVTLPGSPLGADRRTRQPYDVATDPATGLVYVTEPGRLVVSEKAGTIVARIKVGGGAFFVAVDPLTNTSYVTDTGSRSVSVIAG